MRVVIDTNVLVSALLKTPSVPASVVEAAVLGRIRPLIDGRILAEYREVLERPRFGFDPSTVEKFLSDFEAVGEIVEVTQRFTSPVPDSDDLPFIEVALSAMADAIVTGNTRDFPNLAVPVYTPAQLLEQVALRWR